MILAQTSSTGSGLGLLLPIVFFVAIFYFLILRPQRTRARQQQELVASLVLGDRVQTIGGIHGVVRSLDDEAVVLEVEQGRIKVARRAIASKVTTGES